MMSSEEFTTFTHESGTLAAQTLARGGDLRTVLTPVFHRARCNHPDDEDRLLELWDQLTSRPML